MSWGDEYDENFLEETTKALARIGYTPDDVVYIGNKHGLYCEWEDFTELADFTYDRGYGTVHIPYDLCIYTKDGGRFVRREYDGSEWWGFIEPFNVPEKKTAIVALRTDGQWWPDGESGLEDFQDKSKWCD